MKKQTFKISGLTVPVTRVVQDLLFQKDYRWPHGDNFSEHAGTAFVIHAHEDGSLFSNESEEHGFRNPIVITSDAEFGKFAAALEAPPEVRIKLTNHEAVVKSDKSGVQIGCQFAPKDTVRKVRDALAGHKDAPKTIRVTGVENKMLRKLVLGLFGGGYESDGDVFWNNSFKSLLFENGKYWTQDYPGSGYGEGAPSFDARTEMGKLIELLEGKNEQSIKIKLRGEDGLIARDQEAIITETGVTVKGETITREQVEEIWKALQ